jgi:hypothetical protein
VRDKTRKAGNQCERSSEDMKQELPPSLAFLPRSARQIVVSAPSQPVEFILARLESVKKQNGFYGPSARRRR